MQNIAVDIIIIGGGIAGLWCLNIAKKHGYSAILIEKHQLGGMQTIGSQGIIHGGTKYSLTGKLSSATQAISDMPGRWQRAIQGKGEIDLSNTQVTSDTHYLWSIDSLSSKVTTFFASKAMHNKAKKVKPEHYPAIFKSPNFTGTLYALNEWVLDTPSLIENLVAPHWDNIIQLDVEKEAQPLWENKQLAGLRLDKFNLEIHSKTSLLTCGEAFPSLANFFGLKKIDMQLRPLQMVAVKHKHSVPLFGHAIGAASKPLMTVTSHQANINETVWYLGGQIAEDGVGKPSSELIEDAKIKLKEYLPWVELKETEWSAININRAEPSTHQGARPDSAFLANEGNIFVAWPTKLTLAPQLGDQFVDALKKAKLSPETTDLSALSALPKPQIAKFPWEKSE